MTMRARWGRGLGTALNHQLQQAGVPSLDWRGKGFHPPTVREGGLRKRVVDAVQIDYTLKGAEKQHVDPKGCTVPNGQCTNDLQGRCSAYSCPRHPWPVTGSANDAVDLHVSHYRDFHRSVAYRITKGSKVGDCIPERRDDVPLLGEPSSGGLRHYRTAPRTMSFASILRDSHE